jgi:hypothetical protein
MCDLGRRTVWKQIMTKTKYIFTSCEENEEKNQNKKKNVINPLKVWQS